MPWYYPPQPVIASEVLDIEVINRNLHAWQMEVGGELNEHNIAEDGLSGDTHEAEDGLSAAFHSEKDRVDPYGGSQTDIEHVIYWSDLDGMEKTFVTKGGKVLLVASFQLGRPSFSSDPRQSGLMFAFEVDGSVLFGSLCGSGDLSNDIVAGGTGLTFTPDAGGYTIDWGTGPGLRRAYFPVVLEKVVHLTPGEHTVKVVSRNLATLNSGTAVHWFGSFDLLALEMWSN